MDEETTDQPTLSVEAAERVTADGGTAVEFTLRLDESASADVTFDFAVEAEPDGDGEDRTLRTDTGTIPAGESSATVQVVLDDVDTAATEEIDFKLTGTSGAQIGEDSQSFEFASDDDSNDDEDGDDDDDDGDDADDDGEGDEGMVTLPPPARFDVSPNPQIVSESGDGSVTTADFEVSRAFPGFPPVRLDYRVVVPEDGSGADADDFGGTLPEGQLSFGPGPGGSQTITIPIAGDGETEPTESFRLEVVDPVIGDDPFTGIAGFANGLIEGTGEPDGGGDDSGGADETDDGSDDSGDDATTATRAILAPESTLNLVDSADVVGRTGGDEGVFLTDGVTDAALDANIEALDISKPLADLSFQVTDAGLAISAGGGTLVSVPSLNQDVTLAVDGGSATLTQTGAQTFELTTSAGDSVTIGTDAATSDPDLTLDSGGASAPEPGPESAADIFVAPGASYTVGDAVHAFGRSGGDEALRLTDAAQNVTADANFERFDFAQALDALTFQVTDSGLTVSEGETTLLTVPSLNADVDARFEGGNLTLRQTGAQTFEAEGADGSTTSIGTDATTLDLPLGDAASATADGGTAPDVQAVGPADDGSTFDATGGDLTFDVASGDYGVTIDGFDEGDVLDARDVAGDTDASAQIESDADLTDGKKQLTLTDPTSGEQVAVDLIGLSESQESGAFNATNGFADTFGDDALML